jgi:L-threonylcarbamoyladenylate synthase
MIKNGDLHREVLPHWFHQRLFSGRALPVIARTCRGRMETKVIVVDRKRLEDVNILSAAEAVKEGKIVVFPTETVYGIGCRYDDESARERVFALKRRERSKPLGIYLLSASEVEEYALMPPMAEKLSGAFLPGPLTLVLPGRRGGKLGFRIPSDEVTRRLIRLCGIPLSGTSANLSGRESPTTGQQAIAAMHGRADYIIDAGKTELACPSTVIDLCVEPPVVLREGAIPLEALSQALGCEVQKAS